MQRGWRIAAAHRPGGSLVPHGQSGSEPQKETGESHRRRSTHHGVAEVAARKWLSSWPPATVGTGICSSPYQECLLRYAPGLIEWSLLVSATMPGSINVMRNRLRERVSSRDRFCLISQPPTTRVRLIGNQEVAVP